MRRVASPRVNGLVRPLLTLTLAVAGFGCHTDVPAEPDVAPCSVDTLDDGTVHIQCPDGTEQTLEPQVGVADPGGSGLPDFDRYALDVVLDSPKALDQFNASRQARVPGRVILRGSLPATVELSHLQSAAAVVTEATLGMHTLRLSQLREVGNLRVTSAANLTTLEAPRLREVRQLVMADTPRLDEARFDALRTVDTLTLEVTSGALFSAPAAADVGAVHLVGGAWRGQPHHVRLDALTALPGGLDLRASGPVTVDLSALTESGPLTLQGAPRTVVELPELTAVAGDLLVLTPALPLALPALTEVDGTLSLVAGDLAAPELRRLGGLVIDGPGVMRFGLPNLVEIEGQALVRDTALRSVTLPRLTRLGTGAALSGPRLEVTGNANLQALTLPVDGAVGATVDGPQIRVAGNFALCGARMRLPPAEVVFDESARCR